MTWLEFPDVIELFDVIGNRDARLGYGFVLEDIPQRSQPAQRVKLKDEDFLRGGQLKQRRRIRNTSLKGRPRFRVETQQRLLF